ncbi:hypothetical protein [Nonomuraea sp. KM90]|uniref:hypothetical protein n=1 Tax=Nonomuraea sp. KM90 TaxID=3457428 RepID=UPI003FCDA937
MLMRTGSASSNRPAAAAIPAEENNAPTAQRTAAFIDEAGLPHTTEIAALLGLTWHVTRPLAKADPPISTLAHLDGLTDDDITSIPGSGSGCLGKLKTAFATAATLTGATP